MKQSAQRITQHNFEILIKNEDYVANIKEQWKSISPSQFHVLADFDRTLTKGNVGGRPSSSIIALIRDGNYLSSEYREAAYTLYNQYHPIEIDTVLPLEERILAMEEWWKQHFELLSNSGLSQEIMRQVVTECPLEFREGTETFIDALKTAHVPMVILSAAPGDMIELYMEQKGISTELVSIIANRYEFDTYGHAIRLKEPIIHSLNKHEITVAYDPDFNADVSDRKHVLLLGDGIGDVGMIEGFPYESLLKVGFLNVDVDKRKQHFMDAYDIVITHDGPMTPVVDLLNETIFST